MQKKCIVVLGMHRSGTSALTGVLSLLGIYPGENLLPAMEDVNPKGFWEHAEIVSIHDQLLGALGSAWYDVNPLPEQWWLTPIATECRNKIVSVLHRDFSNHNIWVIKDPRMCRLLQLWQEVFRELGCKPLYILSLREPNEVAHSLLKRDDLEEVESCLLWLTHMLEAEYQTRGQLRTFVNFECLMSDWNKTIDEISATLHLTWPIQVEDAASNINAYLDPSLRHHTVGGGPSLYSLCNLAQEGFKLLSAPTAETKLDSLRIQTELLARHIAPLSKQLCHSKLKVLEGCQTLASANSANDAARIEILALQREIFRIKNSVSWQVTKPLRLIQNSMRLLVQNISKFFLS